MIVRDPKTRAKKTREANSDSDEEQDPRFGGGGFRGSRVSRGGERGGRDGERGGRDGERGGRGGFFKNSSKRTE